MPKPSAFSFFYLQNCFKKSACGGWYLVVFQKITSGGLIPQYIGNVRPGISRTERFVIHCLVILVYYSGMLILWTVIVNPNFELRDSVVESVSTSTIVEALCVQRGAYHFYREIAKNTTLFLWGALIFLFFNMFFITISVRSELIVKHSNPGFFSWNIHSKGS